MTNKQRKRQAAQVKAYTGMEDNLWFGTQESWDNVMKYKEMVSNLDFVKSQEMAYGDDTEEDRQHPMVQVVDSVGIINIEGSLVYGAVPDWALHYNVCGYDNIKDAVMNAIAGGAKSLIYSYKTGGGAVMGCGASGEFIAEVGKKYPSVSFTDSACFSAGVWQAASTGDIRASKFARIGSIGVLQILENMVKYFDSEGIGHDVFRSTPLKGAGNGVEEMTAEHKAFFQKGVNQAAGMFTEHLSTSLRLEQKYVTDTLATADIWYAEDAKNLGLVKKIQTLDQLVLEMSKKTVNNPSNRASIMVGAFAETKLTGENDMKYKTVEEAEAAAAASLEATTEAATTESLKATTEAAATTGAEITKPAEAPETTMASVIQNMQAQCIALSAELATTKAKVTDLEAKLVTTEAESASAKPYLASYINGLRVKSGGAAADTALLVSQPLSTLVAYADTAKSEFHTKMGQPGQKSVVNPQDKDEAVDKAVGAVNAAVLRLASF